jgi:hypothetical protein
MGFGWDDVWDATKKVGSAAKKVAGYVPGPVGALFADNNQENEFRSVNELDPEGLDTLRRQSDELFLKGGDRTDSSFGRKGQSRLARQLQELVANQGRGGVADSALARALQQATAQQQALAASTRGAGGLAQRQAAQGAATATQGLAGQGAIARLQEMQQAQSLLGNLLGQARGQDLDLVKANDALQLGALDQRRGAEDIQLRGNVAEEQSRASRFQSLVDQPTRQERFQKGAVDAFKKIPFVGSLF